jgi:hypothetical protein
MKIEAGTQYSQALLALIEEEYETLDDGIYTLADALGVSDEEFVGFLQSTEIELSQEQFDAIADEFDTLEDDDVYIGLLGIAMDSTGDIDLDAVLEDEDEDEDEYEYEDELEPVGSYSASRRGVANFSSTVDPRVAELEARLTTVETFSAVRDRLASLTAKADFGVQEGWLPPVARQALVANFSREDDMVAEFSMLAAANGVDVDAQIHAMDFALELFERCGNLVDFNQYAQPELDPIEVQRSTHLDTSARDSLRLMGLVK